MGIESTTSDKSTVARGRLAVLQAHLSSSCVESSNDFIESLPVSTQVFVSPPPNLKGSLVITDLKKATFERPTPESLQITLKGALRAKLDGVRADIMVALCESGLVTDCQDGVNKDRMLANDFGVRKLTKLCSIENLPPKKIITGSLECDLWQGFNNTKCGIVVFVQQHGTRYIFGSHRIQLPAYI